MYKNYWASVRTIEEIRLVLGLYCYISDIYDLAHIISRF